MFYLFSMEVLHGAFGICITKKLLLLLLFGYADVLWEQVFLCFMNIFILGFANVL